MLDGLLGRGGFSSKCKSLIKPTKARIEVLRRRAEAKQRFLKEDLAKLLANGLDVNAYGRTEEFIAGLNLLACYNFIEQSCEYILKQLSIMQKQGQCPEDCRETVASLMFAAARFSDLPELRDLRDVFQERYGNGLECYVNQVFIEKLASKPPVMEKRVKLLQDIAGEFSIQWDSRAFKQRMDKPSVLAQDEVKKHGLSRVDDDKYKLPNGMNAYPKGDKSSKERTEHAHDRPFVGREEKRGYNYDHITSKAESNRTAMNDEHLSRARRESAVKKHGSSAGKDDTPLMRNGSGSSSHDRMPEIFVNNKMSGGREEKRGYKHEQLSSKVEPIEKREKDDHLPRAMLESTAKHGLSAGKEETPSTMKSSGRSSRDGRPEIFVNERVNAVQKGDRPDSLSRGKSEVVSNGTRTPVDGDGKSGSFVNGHVNQQNPVKSKEYVQQEDAERLKSTYSNSLPPPYVKLHIPPPYSKPEGKGSRHTKLVSDDSYKDPSPHFGANVVNNLDRIPKKQDSPYHEHEAHRVSKHVHPASGGSSIDPLPHNEYEVHRGSKHAGSVSAGSSLDPLLNKGSNSVINLDRIQKESDHGHGKDGHYQNEIPLPKPRSIRRKHSKSSSSHDDVGSSEGARIVKRTSSSRRKEKKGLQILFDDEQHHRDEEERMMDKLLLHYSKKSSTYDIGKLRRKKSGANTSRSPHHRSRDEANDETEMAAPPTRSISLPHEQSGESEPKKVFARANSFQPDNQARHVHPKLPDYDDLAARFAALKGR